MIKTVLITGASSGIGKEMARVFSENKHNLVLVSRNKERLELIKGELESKYHNNIVVISKDLTQKDAPQEIYEILKDKNINIEYLVNNAGIGTSGEFAFSDLEKQLKIVELNIIALIKMTYLFLPAIINNKGKIINVASTEAFAPIAKQSVYAASKAFVLSFSQALYEECRNKGVIVMTLCPGVTETEFFASANLSLSNFNAASPSDVARFAYKSLLKDKPLVIHRNINKIIALLARVLPFSIVRKFATSICNE